VQDGRNTRFCCRKSLSDGQWEEQATPVFVQVEVYVQSLGVGLNVNNKARHKTAREGSQGVLPQLTPLYPVILLDG
jgi:hypothetical protein